MRTLLATIAAATALSAADATEFFEMKVRPVLANKCFACHSNSRMGGLDLTSREAALKGGNSGPAIVPSQPDQSLMLQAVAQTHARLKMPPSGKLPDEDVEAIKTWIAAGAIWPAKSALKEPPPPAEYRISEQQRAYWAFRPVVKPDAKSIDELWMRKLIAKGIKPNAPADKRTLIRRAYFDLTGLPPSPADVEKFVNDKSPDAFAKVVDQLLASPRYGERWGRYWLDVARYSDDQLASQFEIPHPAAFRYRDWVIESFNNDLPYDTFVKAQFAGDLIKGREKELAVGTGFFSLSPEQQDDRVDAATRGFLALTVACAQCHDHKFDPIPQRDYYSLLGIFMSTKKDEYPLAAADVVSSYKAHEASLTAKRQELTDLQNAQARELEKVFAYDTAKYVAAAKGGPADGLDPIIVKRWTEYLGRKTHEHPYLKSSTPEQLQTLALEVLKEKHRIDDENHVRLGLNPNRKDLSSADLLSLPRDKYFYWRDLFGEKGASIYFLKDKDLDHCLGAPIMARVEQLRDDVAKAESAMPAHYAFAETISDVEEPKDIHVWIRGSRDNPGEIAPRRFLQILSKQDRPLFKTGSGRLELAESIADASNPLTPRVMANRIWQWHFGRGIVATPSNFGKQAEPPSNPELLDYLAARFIEQGWSVKKLQREIMLSQVYALSSDPNPKSEAIDGDNRYQWRANRNRLDIEALRDSMLAVTGELDLRMGGQPMRIPEESNKRRTVYGFVSRRDLDITLGLFDFANPNATNERRIETSTPLQRLYLLNSAFVERRADELACRLEKFASPEAKIREAYNLLFQRQPTKEEIALGLQFVRTEARAWPRYAQVLLASNEFIFTD